MKNLHWLAGTASMFVIACGSPAGGVDGGPSQHFTFDGDASYNTLDAGTADASRDAGGLAGSDTCRSLIGQWMSGLPESDFASQSSFNAYMSLDKCGCFDTSTGTTPAGCEDICSGTSPKNFCNGVPPLSQCATCLTSICSAAYTACMSN
jgi:hypothetical protein